MYAKFWLNRFTKINLYPNLIVHVGLTVPETFNFKTNIKINDYDVVYALNQNITIILTQTGQKQTNQTYLFKCDDYALIILNHPNGFLDFNFST